MDAPYTGGYVPGGRIFAVDGDFSVLQPDGPPQNIAFPFEGDSNPGFYPIVLMDRTANPANPNYVQVPLGSGFNQQPFSDNRAAVVFEQDFIIAQQNYVPMLLNTLYDPAWSLGWENPDVNFADCFLVEEGRLQSLPGGLVRIRRKFANLPPPRNERDSYDVSFPGISFDFSADGGDSLTRLPFSEIVSTRVFYEFFVFDENGLLPGIQVFPAGYRIDSTFNAVDNQAIILEKFNVFASAAGSVTGYNIVDTITTDGVDSTTPIPATYLSWMGNSEIVVEASSFRRWMGNIFMRRTRFALAI